MYCRTGVSLCKSLLDTGKPDVMWWPGLNGERVRAPPICEFGSPDSYSRKRVALSINSFVGIRTSQARKSWCCKAGKIITAVRYARKLIWALQWECRRWIIAVVCIQHNRTQISPTRVATQTFKDKAYSEGISISCIQLPAKNTCKPYLEC